MINRIKELETAAATAIAAADTEKAVEDVRVQYLGKKGELTAVLKLMGGLSAEERPVIGASVNALREKLESELAGKKAALKDAGIDERLATETLDVTIPGRRGRKGGRGRRHPLNVVMDEMCRIFRDMGYSVVYGPEVEETKYVFDMLNTFEGHPARDVGDTFYVRENAGDSDTAAATAEATEPTKTVLRTQTSSVQIRTMLENSPPLAIISPGRVYRVDEADRTHSPIFHQCEGLIVGENITFADLKGTLTEFFRRMYGEAVKLRFRPHHFPYTEPSAEVDLSCFKCGGNSNGGNNSNNNSDSTCPFCHGEGWLELLGSGFVHPQVLRNCNIDPDKYTGFAFGIGIERLTLMRYEIDDIRLLYDNNLKFLQQQALRA